MGRKGGYKRGTMKGETSKRKRGSVLFGAYVKRRREKYGISVDALCEGLCIRQELGRLEKGAWEPGYFVREALLARLGTEAETYEYFLEYQDMEQVERRKEIGEDILWKRTSRAGERLEEYRLAYAAGRDDMTMDEFAEGQSSGGGWACVEKRLAMQFYFGMLGQARRQTASRKELHHLFARAVGMTVPETWKMTLEGLVLSACELDFILEAERNRMGGARPAYLLDLIRYIEKGPYDGRARAKVYPKAVCLYFRSQEGHVAGERVSALESCSGERADKAGDGLLWGYGQRSLDMLMGSGRMYYLWEILDMRGRLLERRIKRLVRQGSWLVRDVEAMLEKNRSRKRTLEQIYDTWDMGRETLDGCYVYIPKTVYCINEVIRIRRKMLGISAGDLCRGICSVDTLRRLESRKTAPQREIVRELLRRLGMPGEFACPELETDDLEALELLEEMRERLDKCYWEDAEVRLRQIERNVDMEIPCNRQLILSVKATIRWRYHEITDEEYSRLQKEALEVTMPFGCFLGKGEKCLTNMERTCIRNMMTVMDKGSGEFAECMEAFEELCKPYTEKEAGTAAEGMHVPIMCMMGEECGNIGKHDRADLYLEAVIQDALRLHRLWELPHALYGRWRNEVKRQKRGSRDGRGLDTVEEISKCLILWEMAGNRNKVLLCQEILDEWKSDLD